MINNVMGKVEIERALRLLEEIKKAAAGREIEIVAATKTVSFETIKELFDNTPIKVAGENRAQELMQKYHPSVLWDFIGRLQTNKVKYIIDKVRLIQSLDRRNLLETINKEAAKHNKVQDVLLQINTGKEEVKGGVNPEEALEAASAIQNYANVRLKGIMAVTPLDISVSERQKCFDTAYGIFAQLKQSYKGIEYLSMGMSNDYIQAIESGANMIRPGRAIFGERAY